MLVIAIIISSGLAAKGALSPDGMIPAAGPETAFRALASIDPELAYACLVSGTGLTHHSSAKNRQMMHLKDTDKLTDSMKIYQWACWATDATRTTTCSIRLARRGRARAGRHLRRRRLAAQPARDLARARPRPAARRGLRREK